MAPSQKSFETRFGRFYSGNELLQANPDYNPQNILITKPELNTFISDVSAKDEAVNLAYKNYRDKVKIRRENGFRDNENLENCLENRIRTIASYVGADIGRTSASYKIIKDFIKKIKPIYKKKDPEAPRGDGKSPSEKSFVALIGYGVQTTQIIKDLGAAYSPVNADIQVVAMQDFCTQMEKWTVQIVAAENIWAEAVRLRLELYDGNNGMSDRIVMIKDYLASFPGGKKNQNYIEFDRIIKGK